ncbi:metal transporter Nramp4 isoform X1 [Oryza sativa Japonica Group]|uniref:metal transporter Nramp4 isoform X1 n=1 Tax=Oryza sativa subsp. japonica TaxID=39947 RepID=UPI00003B31EE|nr:metal transporter Nramp4 isoform X2 [Oryza sativa Japonica Group]
MEEGAKIGREHEQQQQQHGRVNGSGRVAAVGGGSGGGGDEIEIEVAAAAGASPSRQHGGLHGDVQAPTWKRFLAHVGPGFVISIAYLDPSNLQTDLVAGSSHRYSLLWVLLFGFIFVLTVQSLAANLGIITGRHLAELCMGEYPKYVKYCLWLLAELGVIAATIPGVLGTALAYNMLLHIPFWAGVLACGACTFLILGLQGYGARKMEFTISVLMLVMATCFFMELGKVNPPAGGVIEGLFIPRPKGDYSTSDAVAMFGSLVVPHNLFLHSSLVLTRKMPYTSKGRKDASTFFLLENALALFIALLVNVAIVSISGTICANNLSFADTSTCSSLTLNSTYVLLKNILGKSSSTVYGVALLVSGQSCMVATSYAGQYIMQIVLSFVLPFALIPLIKFSSSCTNIGPYKNATSIIRIAWILSLVIIGINIYFFCTSFVAWLVHSDLPRVVNAIISSLVFPFMAAYIAALIYLAFRKVNLSDPFPTNSVSGEIEVQHIQIQEKQEDLGVHL